jgi:hypothetical protein
MNCRGRYALKQAGLAAMLAVESVVELDRAPTGIAQLEALKCGLQALSAYWSAKRKPR